MRERPIIFNTEMVQAILGGRKTVTRRVMRPQPSEGWEAVDYGAVHKLVNEVPDEMKPIGWGPTSDDGLEAYKSPYGKPGDLLYVRETFCKWDHLKDPDGVTYSYKANHWHQTIDGFGNQACEWVDDALHSEVLQWKPSIHMPKAASRIWLRVKDVRVERVQDITGLDVVEEGIDIFKMTDVKHDSWQIPGYPPTPVSKYAFELLWGSINAKRGFGWDVNPWVWCLLFQVISINGRPEGAQW